MASITSAGIGSGLDVSGLVSQLVAAERQPTASRIARQEASVQARLSAYGTLTAALSDFRDKLEAMKELDTFLARKASSSDEEIFGVSVSSNAVPASYSVEVVSLASSERLTSAAFADTATAVGTGTLQIDVGGSAFSVELTAENNTLAGIRDTINAAADNSGVSATIVNAQSGSYLVLSGRDSGSDQTITVTQSGGDGGLSSLEYDPANGLNALTQTRAAADALVRIDGLDVVSSTNSVTGAIDGVTIDLEAAAPGTTETLTIENDEEAIRGTINDFVESYNKVVETIGKQSAFNADTSVAGPLLGDSTLRNVRDSLRRELSTAVSDSNVEFSTLREIGIEIELDGKMTVNDDELSAAFAGGLNSISQLFAGPEGFASRLYDRADSFIGDDGLITARTEGLDKTVEGFAEQREALALRMESLESRLLRQFNALDALVGQLSNTSNFLTQQLAALPTVGGNNK